MKQEKYVRESRHDADHAYQHSQQSVKNYELLTFRVPKSSSQPQENR